MYNSSRNAFLSPNKKPSAGTLLKTYSYRPSSALRASFEPDTYSQSPNRTDSRSTKKPSLSRYPTAGPVSKTQTYNSRHDESLSNSNLNRSSSKYDKSLSIETSSGPSTYAGSNLKGYSITNTNSQTGSIPRPISSSMATSKHAAAYSASPLSNSFAYNNRTGTPNGNTSTSLSKKYNAMSRSITTNPSLSNSSSNFYSNDMSMSRQESRGTLSNSFVSPSRRADRFAEEDNYLPPFEPTKCSIKQNGVIKAYGVNTHQGLVRNYNEDRVAIILNIMKPEHLGPNDEWPVCSFFGVYDGHGGANCADFLRDNLHQYVIQDKNFPKNPVEALRRGFEEAEKAFKEVAQRRAEVDNSGSCAVVALIVEDMCYVANVGDSRVVASMDHGKKSLALSRDHKPNDKDEQKRIIQFGGKVYQSQITQPPGYPGPKVILGPHRVFPGRLSVSRAFGDIEAKLPKYGGNPYVLTAEPEIKSFRITNDWDFLVLACDGIYDKMETEDVVNCMWDSTMVRETDVHKQSAVAVEKLMKESLIRKSYDNVTVVMVSFSGFEKANFAPKVLNTEQDPRRAGNDTPSRNAHKNSFSNSGLYQQEKFMANTYGNSNTSTNRSFVGANNDRFNSSFNNNYDVKRNTPVDHGSSYLNNRNSGTYWRTGY